MKKVYLFLFILTLFYNINGQNTDLKITPTEIYTHADTLGFIDTSKVYFEYTGIDSVTVFWKLVVGANFPKKYTFQICDKVLCYNYNTKQQSKNKPNWIAKNKVFFSFYLIDTFNLEFKDTLQWEFYSDKEFTNLISKVPIFIGSSAPVATNEKKLPLISVYPSLLRKGETIFINSDESFEVLMVSPDGKFFTPIRTELNTYKMPDELPSGIYFLQVRFSNGKKVFKILVQ